MIDTANLKNIGLRGVTVADTKISHVDGANGILIYRGYRIEDLARHSTFEETAYLLLHDMLPSSEQLERFKMLLAEAGMSLISFATASSCCPRRPIRWMCSKPLFLSLQLLMVIWIRRRAKQTLIWPSGSSLGSPP